MFYKKFVWRSLMFCAHMVSKYSFLNQWRLIFLSSSKLKVLYASLLVSVFLVGCGNDNSGNDVVVPYSITTSLFLT